MPDQPLPLFRVLIEEYNHQYPEKPYSDPETLEDAFQKYINVQGMDEESKEKERERINSDEVKKFYRWLHGGAAAQRSALCFSGGGIRSATFGLGVLQGLARKGLLAQFDFLSTVSGGGYLGSWLSAWVHRKGLEKVERRLKNEWPASPLKPEPDAISHLRTYSNYMSPKVGLLSADTWTLVAIFFRNLILNWLVLLPLILLVLMIPRICVWVVKHPVVTLRPWLFWLGAVIMGVIAIAYIYANRPSLADPKLRGYEEAPSTYPNERKTQGWFLWRCLLPLLILAVSITTFYSWPRDAADDGIKNGALSYFGNWLPGIIGQKFPPPFDVVFAFILFGVILHLGGWIFSLRYIKPDWREPLAAFFAGGLGGGLTWLIAYKIFPSPVSGSLHMAAYYVCFAAPLFIILLLLTVTVFIGVASRFTSDEDREWLARAGAWLIIASVAWTLISVLVIFGPSLLVYGIVLLISLPVGVASGMVTLVLGYGGKTQARSKEASGASDILLMIAAPIFAVFILICLSLGTSWLIAELSSDATSLKLWDVARPYSYDGLLNLIVNSHGDLLVYLFLAFLVIGLAASIFVNINKFSLHGAYRDRLIRAYLGASRIEEERKPNPFTGLDENDNLQMQQLRTQLFHDGNVRKTIQVEDSKLPDFTLLIEKLKRAGELKKGKQK